MSKIAKLGLPLSKKLEEKEPLQSILDEAEMNTANLSEKEAINISNTNRSTDTWEKYR